jgi:Dolichyl-phosphate-mannose-protein mannosyltransferase
VIEPDPDPAPSRHPLALAAVLAASLAYAWLLLDRGWVPHDEGMLAQSAVRVLLGEVPHRDFDEVYTGGLSYLNALAFQLFGERLLSLRYLSFAAFAAWVPLVYYLAARFVGPLGAAAITLTSVVYSYPNYPAAMPSWYNLILATGSLAALFRYLDTRRTTWLAVAGVCAGLSVLIKVVGLYLVAATLLFFAFMEQSGERRPDDTASRWSGVTVILGCLGVIGGLLLFVRSRLGLPEFAQFVLPGATVAGAVAIVEVRRLRDGDGMRLGYLTRLAAPYLGGFLLPLLIFGAFYAGHDALGDLLSGVFVRPFRRLSLAGRRPPPFVAILPAVIAAGILLLALRSAPRARALLAGGVAIVLLPLLRPEESAGVGMLGWLSISQAIPLTVLLGTVGSRRTLSGPEPRILESRSMFLLVAALAFCNLVQFPWTNPTYFCFVAPLQFLALAAILRPNLERLQPVASLLLVFYAAHAVLWLTPLIYRNYNNSADLLSRAPLTVMLPDRAGLMVHDSIAVEYDSLVSLVRAEARGEFIYAGPDSPEVYFLSGFRNPTMTIFEFLDDPEERTARTLGLLDRADVNLVVLNSRPGMSAPITEALASALRDRYPNSAEAGRFTVRWR